LSSIHMANMHFSVLFQPTAIKMACNEVASRKSSTPQAFPLLTGDPQTWCTAPLVSVEQITRQGLDLILTVAGLMKDRVEKQGGL